MVGFGKRAGLFVVAAVLALIGVQSSAADPAAEVAAIHAVDDAWVKAYNAGAVDAVVGLYDEQAVLLPPGAPRAKGRAEIRSYLARDIAESQKGGLKFTLGARPDGGVSGDLGWASGSYAVKDRAGRIVETGKYLSVSKKKDGKWLYVRDTWNSDSPAAAEPASPPKK